MTALVELQDVTKEYGSGRNRTKALEIDALQVQPREFVAIEGPSGCGKSTLVHILGLLDQPTQGKVLLLGHDVATISERAKARLRNQSIGFVFQHFNLLPHLTALQNVMLPMLAAGIRRKERLARAGKLLDRVGLASKAHNLPGQLSGGEQQRVAVARALANEPKLLLADEPTGNLDRTNADGIMALFKELHEERGTAIVVVTHDPKVSRHAQRVLRHVGPK